MHGSHPRFASEIEGFEEFLDVGEAGIVLGNLCFPEEAAVVRHADRLGNHWKQMSKRVETNLWSVYG